MEPGSTTAGVATAQFVSKTLAGLAGLFGGLSISFFWQPKKLHQHGRFMAGLIIGGIAVSAAFLLGGSIALWIGVDFTNTDVALGLGYVIGATSVGTISFLANFFDRREDRDILEIATELRAYKKSHSEKPTKKKPTKKVTKKVSKKKAAKKRV